MYVLLLCNLQRWHCSSCSSSMLLFWQQDKWCLDGDERHKAALEEWMNEWMNEGEDGVFFSLNRAAAVPACFAPAPCVDRRRREASCSVTILDDDLQLIGILMWARLRFTRYPPSLSLSPWLSHAYTYSLALSPPSLPPCPVLLGKQQPPRGSV